MVGRGNHTRQVNSIIGVLLKKHFPGLITLHGKEEPGFTWAHYQAAPDKNFGNKAERIKAEIWVSVFHSTIVSTRSLTII